MIGDLGPTTFGRVEDITPVEFGRDVTLGQLPGEDVGSLRVVVGQRVAGAAAEGGRPEGDRRTTRLDSFRDGRAAGIETGPLLTARAADPMLGAELRRLTTETRYR